MVGHALEQQRAYGFEVRPLVEEVEEAGVLLEDPEVLAPRGPHRVALAPLPVPHADVVQAGDGLRGEHGLVDHQRVFVDAFGEGEPMAGVELAAVHPVPHHGEHREVLGTLQGREHVGPRRGEQFAGGTDLHTVRPVRTHVVEEQDVRVPDPLQPVGDGLQGALGQGVVTVQEEQVVPGRTLRTQIAGLAYAPVLVEVNGPHPAVPCRVFVEYAPTGIRRVVVDGDDLEVGERLLQDGVQTRAQVTLNPVHRNDKAYPGVRRVLRVTHAWGFLGSGGVAHDSSPHIST